MRKIFMVTYLLAIPGVATAQSLGWQKYTVPETGANLDLPVTMFINHQCSYVLTDLTH